MPWKTIVYRRAELYEQVWTVPALQLAKRYGVSNTALAKTCRKLNVPRPTRGYWAKVEHGKSPRRPKLPPLSAGMAEALESRVSVPEEDVAPRPNIPAEVREIVERERNEPVVVPEQLERPHPLVAACRRALRGGSKTRYGLLSRGKQQALDVSVSSGQLSRAMRIADAFVRACDKRGIRIELRRKSQYKLDNNRIVDFPEDETHVVLGCLDLEFRLREKVKEADRGEEDRFWGRQHFDATGVFELCLSSFGNSKTLRDRPGEPIEARLSELFAWLPVAAHDASVREEAARVATIERAKQEAEEKRIREERERIRQEA